MFAKYHYLSSSLNPVARTFVCTVNGNIAVFASILFFMHPRVKNHYRSHRIVVLPDFQGIGLSRYIENYIGELLACEGKTYSTITSNPARIANAKNDPNWIITRLSRETSKHDGALKMGISLHPASSRLTATLKYVGNTNKL